MSPKKKYLITITELIRINPISVFFLGFIPPLLGAVLAIAVGLIFHNEKISNYNWQCGRAKLPSLSRIINLPVERTFWQLFLLFHMPIRVIQLVAGFCRLGRTQHINCNRPLLYKVSRFLYLSVGLLELIFLSGLSVIGERESISAHVWLFYVFGTCSLIHMVTNTFCHGHSAFYMNPYGRLSYHLKILFTVLSILSTPILIISFLLYWRKCITWAYDVFALCEYIGVFLNICFHGCVFFDIRYKMIFSIRLVREPVIKESDKISDKVEMRKY